MSRKLTKRDWEFVLSTMEKYNREEGYVDMLDGELVFFDSDPFINGIHACHVLKEDVKEYIQEADE